MLLLTALALALAFSFSQEIIRDPNHFGQPTGRLAGSHPTCQARQTRTGSASRLDSIPSLLGSSRENEADRRHGLTGYEAPPVVPIFSSYTPPDPHSGLPHPRTSLDTCCLYETCPGSWTLQAISCCAIRASVYVTHFRRARFFFTSLPVSLSPPTGQSWILAVLPCLEPRSLLYSVTSTLTPQSKKAICTAILPALPGPDQRPDSPGDHSALLSHYGASASAGKS